MPINTHDKNAQPLLVVIAGCLLAFIGGCAPLHVNSDQESSSVRTQNISPQAATTPRQEGSQTTLPVRYQRPQYVVEDTPLEDLEIDQLSSIKVGANIRTTKGPQPLWDIIKRLAAMKNMSVSWASDVDKDVLVDVEINARDDYFKAIDNLLRQVDYFHEQDGNTIVIKYKDTRRYRVAMPFTQHTYKTGAGGNMLGNDDTSSNIDGTIELKTDGATFDIWENIQHNMDSILATWTTQEVTDSTDVQDVNDAVTQAGGTSPEKNDKPDDNKTTRKISDGGSVYVIDKPVGMVTVTAPRPVLDKLDDYFSALQEELYRQIEIEAKIIEVQLSSSSSIGINWSSVLEDFSLSGTVEFGADGQIYPSSGSFVSTISLDSADFGLFLNALESQGDTKVLSSPRISVMNGQPALITVGESMTYIDSIESDTDSDTGTTTYTVDTERILSGLGLALDATILGKDEIIMHLVPVTSELEEPIEYLDVGSDGAQVGLPVVDVRELSTTVRMNDGQVLVLGGLISDTKDSSGEFMPLLGQIPIVRYLFGYEEKTSYKQELVILIRARINERSTHSTKKNSHSGTMKFL